MNGYAAAWSSCSSGARKNASCASSPDSITTRLRASRISPTSPRSSRTRWKSAIGDRRISSRCPSSGSPPETRGGAWPPGHFVAGASAADSPVRCALIASRLLARKPDHLGLQVLLEAHQAVLAAHAALAVAAERRVDVEPHAAVGRDGSRADPAGDRERALLVRRADRAGEAVDRVVRDPHRVVVVLERDQAEHWAEDLLLR